jgi:hydroxypyruvate isomerase
MPRFAANLSTMFQERPFLERFAAAAAAGFEAVEYQFAYDHDPAEIRAAIAASGVRLALFNAPPGDFAAGERGLAALPGREADFAATLEPAAAHAEVLAPPAMHVMSGITGDPAARDTLIGNLRLAARRFPRSTIVIEPLNTRDTPGYFLTGQRQGIEIIEAVGVENLKLQFDVYHRQIMDGDLIRGLQECAPHIGHIQIAGNPGRHEPDVGEIHYPAVFEAIDAIGYKGFIGCEYTPKTRTEDGLGWFAPYRPR